MKDWTLDEKTGRSNSSAVYRAIVERVDDLLRHSGFALINGQHESVARLIVSQLAHGPWRLAPRSVRWPCDGAAPEDKEPCALPRNHRGPHSWKGPFRNWRPDGR